MFSSILDSVNCYFLEHITHIPNRFFDNIDKAFDSNDSYEKHLLVRDFNTEMFEPLIESLVYEHELHNLVKEKKTCFMSVHNLTFIDLILENNAIAFQNTTVASPSLSDFRKLVLTVLQTSISKSNTQKLTYIDLKFLILLDLMES